MPHAKVCVSPSSYVAIVYTFVVTGWYPAASPYVLWSLRRCLILYKYQRTCVQSRSSCMTLTRRFRKVHVRRTYPRNPPCLQVSGHPEQETTGTMKCTWMPRSSTLSLCAEYVVPRLARIGARWASNLRHVLPHVLMHCTSAIATQAILQRLSLFRNSWSPHRPHTAIRLASTSQRMFTPSCQPSSRQLSPW